MPTREPLTDAEIQEWKYHKLTPFRIAAQIVVEMRTKWEWYPLPTNTEFALTMDVHPATVGRAKRLLTSRGLLVKAGQTYYVAPSP